jgi:hypothetical protein
MGAGSTIAAASNLGLRSIGLESNKEYFRLAKRAIPSLAMIELVHFNDIYGKTAATSAEAGKSTRRGRAKKFASPKATAEKAVETRTAEPATVVEETQAPVEGENEVQKGTEE